VWRARGIRKFSDYMGSGRLVVTAWHRRGRKGSYLLERGKRQWRGKDITAGNGKDWMQDPKSLNNKGKEEGGKI